MPIYHENKVPAHGSADATVFLLNEAPGDCEATELIPLVATQGGMLRRHLQLAGIVWAEKLGSFPWPRIVRSARKGGNLPEVIEQYKKRDAALRLRAQYITCSNAFDRWPQPLNGKAKFADPDAADVLSNENLERLQKDVACNHRVILICGEFAWLACFGAKLKNLKAKERERLSDDDVKVINARFGSKFQAGWYMGHTGRWNFEVVKPMGAVTVPQVLRQVARLLKWRLQEPVSEKPQ